MSITNLIDKIKSKTSIDKITILFLFIIMGVGISSFALGRLSTRNDFSKNLEISASGLSQKDILTNQIIEPADKTITNTIKEKKYVASKNGKMYYPLGCSGANRIKEENEVWFSSEIEAEKSGYTRSSTCK